MDKLHRLIPIIGWFFLYIIFLLSACTPNPLWQSNSRPTLFRSDEYHLQVELPPGWAGTESCGLINPKQQAAVAFNSWGKPNFCASELSPPKRRRGVSESYPWIPKDGAYIVLISQGGEMVSSGDFYGIEYESQKLDGLWAEQDCWSDGNTTGIHQQQFFKWGRMLYLQVYCGPEISTKTFKAVNQLIASWRFDLVPVGDPYWAWIESRKLLPQSVQPEKFPAAHGSEWSNGIRRSTKTETVGERVVVRFDYYWDDPINSKIRSCSGIRCHWWQIEARPDGNVILTGEGGAALPGEGT